MHKQSFPEIQYINAQNSAKDIKILIPNATGPSNIGDQAILYSLLKILKETRSNLKITILTTDPHLFKKEQSVVVDKNLYDWSFSDSLDLRTKFSRSLQVIISYFFLKIHCEFLIRNKDILKIIRYYKNADIIIFVGCGSLRADKGLKDNYIYIIILMAYLFANLYKVKKILTPTSFGPFYYNLQYKITSRIIEKFNIVSFREIYSGNQFKKYSHKKFLKSSDFALFLNGKNNHKKNQDLIGFTIRKWLEKDAQIYFEKNFAIALYNFSKQFNIIIQPIVQVYEQNNETDNDFKVTENVINYLKEFGVKTNKVIILRDLNTAIKTYGELNLLVGMRMHSNIIAATQGTPFIAISYEYKTEGIARDLGVEDYCIKIEEVNEVNLYNIIMKANSNRTKIKKILDISLRKIRTAESQSWRRIFNSNIPILQ